MANITITFPNDKTGRVLDGFCYQFGYMDFIEDGDKQIPNPESKHKFAKRMLAEVVKNAVKSWEAVQAAEAARKTALEDADKIEIE